MEKIFNAILFTLCLSLSSLGQTFQGTKTYDKSGLQFAYSGTWDLKDKSTNELQKLEFSNPGATIFIGVIVPYASFNSPTSFDSLRKSVVSEYLNVIEQVIPKDTAETQFPCLDFNGFNVIGKKYTGVGSGELMEGELYNFMLDERSVTLVYLGPEKDSLAGRLFWNDLIASLRVNGSKQALGPGSFFAESGGTVDESSLRLVKPSYPREANRQAGKVMVRFTINSTGRVTFAKAIEGPAVFQKAAEQAARQSVFPVMLACGKPTWHAGRTVFSFGL